MNIFEALPHNAPCTPLQVACVLFSMLALFLDLTRRCCELESGGTVNRIHVSYDDDDKNKNDSDNKREERSPRSREPGSSAKKLKSMHGKVFRLPFLFFLSVHFLLLQPCFGKALSSIDYDTSFSSSSVTAARQSGTDVTLSSVPTMEEEGSSGSAMERATSAANGAAVDVTSPNRNVLNAFDALATATIEMEMCRQQTVQLEKQHQHLRL